MKNGVYIEGIGEFPQRSRGDRKQPRLQCAIVTAKQTTARINCLCRYFEGVWLPLEAFPTGDPDWPYRLDRRSINDPHAAECIYRFADDDVRREVADPSSGILEPRVERQRQVGCGKINEPEAGGMRHLAYTGFMSRAFGLGYTRAWASSNRLCWPTRNPPFQDSFREIHRQLVGQPLRDAENVFVAAARKKREIAWGIWSEPLSLDASASRVVRLLRVDQTGKTLGRWFVTLPAKVEREIARQVQIFANLVSPPYFFVAVVSPLGELLKVYIRPVYFDGVDFFPVDSHGERGFGCGLINRHGVFYKPPGTIEFYEALPAAQQLLAIQHWAYEPDFLEFDKVSGCGQIDEVVGFSEENIDYHRHLRQKRVHSLGLTAGTSIRYEDTIWGADFAAITRIPAPPQMEYGPYAQQVLPRLTLPC